VISRSSLTSRQRCSNGCPRKESQLKSYSKIPGSVQTQCEKRGRWAGLDKSWGLNLTFKLDDAIFLRSDRVCPIQPLKFAHSFGNVRLGAYTQRTSKKGAPEGHRYIAIIRYIVLRIDHTPISTSDPDSSAYPDIFFARRSPASCTPKACHISRFSSSDKIPGCCST